MFWSNILHRRGEAAVKRLARVAKEVLEAREDSIVNELHRADHMRAGNGRCGYCVAAAELQRVQSDGWDRLEADVRADG